MPICFFSSSVSYKKVPNFILFLFTGLFCIMQASASPVDALRKKDLGDLLVSGPSLIQGGFNFVEGPVWHPDGYLLFSDIPESRIYRWDEASNQVSIALAQSFQSNGLSFDHNGMLVVCEHGSRRLTIRDPQSFAIVDSIGTYMGKYLNSPNDAIVDGQGRVFFTDPPYGIGDMPDLGPNGLGELFGIYLYDQGSLTLLASGVRPNGLTFTADTRVLYVADTKENCVYAFDVDQASGLLSGKRKFLAVNHPDGIKVDEQDNIYVAALEGVQVFDGSGRHLGTIEVPEQPANLSFGGKDYDTLFITAQHGLYMAKLNTRGIAPFSRINS